MLYPIIISGSSSWIKSAHADNKSFSLSTHSILEFSICGKLLQVPLTRQWFKYGFSSPYFKNVDPINSPLPTPELSPLTLPPRDMSLPPMPSTLQPTLPPPYWFEQNMGRPV